MLFNFRLKPVKDVALFGEVGDYSLSWFGLTDSWYWIKMGDDELLRYHDDFIKYYQSEGELLEQPYVDYYAVRLWEDLLEIVPSILEPVPESILQHFNPGQDSLQYLRNVDNWSNKNGDRKTVNLATGWIHDRKLDLGYLTNPSIIHMWTDGTTMFINWDNREFQENDIPIWSSQYGQFSLPILDFIDEILSFDKRLMYAMNERVQSACKDWPLPDVNIDLDYLKIEHRERCKQITKTFTRVKQQHTDWDAIISALKKIKGLSLFNQSNPTD